MKKYVMIKWIGLLLATTLLISSCESWLQVKMEDKILENALFENLEGYTTALNGIYAELNNQQIYGKNLSMGAIDVMAQYYDVLTPETHLMSVYAKYDFNQSTYKSLFSSVWSKMYNLLANVNLLLENCHRANAPLPGIMEGLITGEAYALRGMLHFDLLRLFGPVYSDETKTTKVMPFMDASDRAIRPMLTAEDILGFVIRDLNTALEMLEDTDPVIKEGPKNGSVATDVNNNLNYRQYRLNYYAIKALLARAYMWGGNTTDAAKHAEDVVKVAEGDNAWFPFIKRTKVLQAEEADRGLYPDRIFSTEVLFGLYNSTRENLHKASFQKDLHISSLLTLYGDYNAGRLRTLFPNENDIRFSLWQSSTVDTVEVLHTMKYAPVGDPTNQYMIPLIRTSEMFLILAECSKDDQTAADYINKIRYARGVLNITVTPETKDQLLAEEFAREEIGEGQLFLFYKRKGMTSIPNGQSTNSYMDMALSNYVWIIPDTEIENRPEF